VWNLAGGQSLEKLRAPRERFALELEKALDDVIHALSPLS
jgi:hypothetical protein